MSETFDEASVWSPKVALPFRFVALSIASLFIAGPALADYPQFKLINQSGFSLVRFYASPASTQNWGRDLFGDNVLNPGYSSYATVPGDGCLYDFRMIFSDDDVLYDTVDLCDVGSYTIN